jgi:phosphocarrier protein
MKSFHYTITERMGLHARPAALLAKAAAKYVSCITVAAGANSADAKDLIALMQLEVKYGEDVKVTIDGADEDTSCLELEELFKEIL